MSAVELTPEQFEASTTDFQKYVLNCLAESVSMFTDEIDCAFDEDGQLVIMIEVPKEVPEECNSNGKRLH
jgi:hypothetical protein